MRVTCYLNIRKITRKTVSGAMQSEVQAAIVNDPWGAAGRTIKLTLDLPDNYLEYEEVTIDLTTKELEAKITDAVTELKQMGAQ